MHWCWRSSSCARRGARNKTEARFSQTNPQSKLSLNYETITAAEEAATQAQAEYLHMYPPQPKPRPPSGFYGVSANGQRWKARVRYDGKPHFLGTYNTKQEAALAYDKKVRHCGGDKPLNYASIEAAEEAAAIRVMDSFVSTCRG